MQYITLSLIERGESQEDLMKPLSNLKVLRKYYIENNDVKSYNDFMYLVKDAVLISGKEDMWSKFTVSKYFININKLLIKISRYMIYN